MPVLRIDLSYDGTDFHGFAPQPGARTVGGELQAALRRLLGGPVRIQPGGRTDAGVHAAGQVVSVESSDRRAGPALIKALNALLGEDVWVRRVVEAAPGFDARRCARSRIYEYTIWNHPERNLWERRRSWHVADPLDVEAMEQACQVLVGRHDFAAFRTHRTQDDPGRGTVRRVLAARWERDPARTSVIRFRIEADAFLRHMVRTVVGSAVQVGRGRLPIEAVGDMLERRERAAAGPTAPAHGLTLLSVTYDEPDQCRSMPDETGDGVPDRLVALGR